MLQEFGKAGGLFEAVAGGGGEVEIERAAVDRGEEILAQQRNNQGHGTETRSEECDQESATMMKAVLEQPVITLPETLEGLLKANLHADERIAGSYGVRGVVLMAAQEIFRHGGNHRARE